MKTPRFNLIPRKRAGLGRFRLSQKGWTLTELMMVVAMISLIVPTTARLFQKMGQAFASDEMHLALKKVNEQTLLRIHMRLEANKHLFTNDASNSGVSFLAIVQTSAAPTPPAVMTGSTLGVSQQGGAVTTFAATGKIAADFGNELFFAAYDYPTTITKPFTAGVSTYTAPMTVSGASITYGVVNGSGPATVLIDMYRFYRYYLTTSTHPVVKGQGVTFWGMVEWRSVQYADFNQINGISDTTLQTAVIKWLTSASPQGGPITLAYDPSQNLPYVAASTYAFYQLSNATGSFTGIASPIIYQADWNYLTQTSTGVLSSGGFAYGISGNSSAWAAAPQTVPQFGTASGDFPGGFEVGYMGDTAGLQILTRSLLVGKGAAPRISWNDTTMIHNTKNVW